MFILSKKNPMRSWFNKSIIVAAVFIVSGCANYGTGPGGALTGADVRNCGIGAAIGLIVSNQVTDIRRSSNKDEWRIASAIAGCAAAPWATRQFENLMRSAVGNVAQTGQPEQIVWDDTYTQQQYTALVEPTRSGNMDGRQCREVRVSGVDAPNTFSDRFMSLCQQPNGSYEIVNVY